MLKRFLHFITYNNAFVLIIFALVGGAGVTLAANPEIQAQIIDSHVEVRSVDNTYILSTDFSNFDPQVQVKSVTEDDEFYYVTYGFTTIEIRDYVWGSFEREEVLKVGKAQIQGKDLGLFVAEELGETISGVLAFVKQVQESEKANGPSLKVVTTAYSGLIGRMLDPVDKEFPGYVPVVQEEVATAVVSDSGTQSENPGARIAREVSQALSGAPGAPVIVLNGISPARVPKGSSYIDLGAIATDDKDEIVTVEVVKNNVDTETVGVYEVVYTSRDSDGNVAKSVVRRVEIYNDGFETIIAPPEPEATSTAPSSEPVAEPSLETEEGQGTTEPVVDAEPEEEENAPVASVVAPPEPEATSTAPSSEPVAEPSLETEEGQGTTEPVVDAEPEEEENAPVAPVAVSPEPAPEE